MFSFVKVFLIYLLGILTYKIDWSYYYYALLTDPESILLFENYKLLKIMCASATLFFCLIFIPARLLFFWCESKFSKLIK